MGEEVKQEQAPAEAKPEEKPTEEKKEEQPPVEEKKEDQSTPPPAEEPKKEEEPPQPPPPFVIYVDLHCMGCAKKIQKSIMKIRGVEEVAIDMAQNQVTIKGVVEPQAVCNIVTKKTKRQAKVLSPLPANEGEPIPEVVTSQVSGLTTVELNVNMHCEACAEQLKKKILKMRGVQAAETEFSAGKVKVTGTMDANKLVDYLYRRTKKQARIIPQPEPEKPPEEPKPDAQPEPEKPAEEPKPEENSKVEPPKEGGEGEQKAPEEPPKEGGEGGENKDAPPPKEEEGGGDGGPVIQSINVEDESMKRMMYYPYHYHYYQQPVYYIERIPPPQLFSDENPNACSIS
uniref:HMA domain-containing protein n=1 Tax=Opuntia streptacantha TaxID=393608 RepID=A0A7C9ECV8_OPUST